MMAYHQHIKMLIHGIHCERSGRVGTGGDHVGIASNGDDIRSYCRCVIVHTEINCDS